MHEHIDIYCERLDPSFWAEPINALTNISFIIAAILAYLFVKSENALDWRSGTLIFLSAAMGVGSTLFHTFAVLWAMLADILPILAYQIIFIVFYSRYVMGLNIYKSGAVLIAFFAAMYISMQLPREWLNGSLEYAPALIFVTGFGVHHFIHGTRERFVILLAALTFLISLTFRSIDNALCDHIAFGTHFLWHILNGVVLYLTTRGFVVAVKK